MKTQNLISVYQGAYAIENDHPGDSKDIKKLKKHEIRNLNSLCDELREAGCNTADFDGYFVGYSIKQIEKEFDLLRIGTNYIINIELKSELKVANKIEKITKQMSRNYYYLKIFSQSIYMFEYIENDGLYKYIIENNQCVKTNFAELVELIKNQIVNCSIDLDAVFVPSHFLISPFNSTDKFISGDYFLTTQQEKIKEEIFASLSENQMIFLRCLQMQELVKHFCYMILLKAFIKKIKELE